MKVPPAVTGFGDTLIDTGAAVAVLPLLEELLPLDEELLEELPLLLDEELLPPEELDEELLDGFVGWVLTQAW